MIRLRNALAALVLIALPVSAYGAESKTLRPKGKVQWDFSKRADSGQYGAVHYQIVGDDCEETPQFTCTVLIKQKDGQWSEWGSEVGGAGFSCGVSIPDDAGTYRVRVDNACGCTLRVHHDLIY